MTRLRVLLIGLLLVGLAACKTATIYNVTAANLPSGSNASDAAIAEAIKAAGERTRWTIKPVAPGKMRGMYSKGRHTAVIEITYTRSTFSIEYVDSTNLQYDGDQIHKAYNKWVMQLEQAIEREAAFRLSK